MTKRTNKQYPNDFKQEAVALVTEQGYLLSEFKRHFEGVSRYTELREKHPESEALIHYYSLINLMSKQHDFSWEREWRYLGNFKFKYQNVVAIVAKNPDVFYKKCQSKLSKTRMKWIDRLPIISPKWSYEDIVEEMAIKVWEKIVPNDYH